MEFKVLFKGEFVEDLTPEEIKAQLMQLFSADALEIEHRFFSKQAVTVIADQLTEDDADRYVSLLRRAGVLTYKDLDVDLTTPLAPEYIPSTASTTAYGNDFVASALAQNDDIEMEEVDNSNRLSRTDRTTVITEQRANSKIKIKYKDRGDRHALLFDSNERIGPIRFLARQAGLILILLAILVGLSIGKRQQIDANILTPAIGFCLLGAFFFFVIITMQRLHDIGKSGLWALIFTLPVLVVALGFAQIWVSNKSQQQAAIGAGAGAAYAFKARQHYTEQENAQGQVEMALAQDYKVKSNTEIWQKNLQVTRYAVQISYAIMFLFYVVLHFWPGTADYNAYGDRPSGNGIFAYLFAIIMLAIWSAPFWLPSSLPDISRDLITLMREHIPYYEKLSQIPWKVLQR